MHDLCGKKLLILGGIALSSEIVKHAKNLGIKVYVTDYLRDSPAKKNADKCFMVSTKDVDGIVRLIETEKIDGIITGFVDMLLPFYQEACERSDKPCYGTKEQFDLFTNKLLFKNLCRKFQIPTVEEYVIEMPLNYNSIKDLRYPILLKPVDNSGGRGIFICETPEEILLNYSKSISFSPSRQVLVERYIKAKEVTIFYYVQNGQILLTAMGDRHVRHFQSGIIPLPVAYTFPSVHLEKYKKSIHNKVVDLLQFTGIRNGMVFIQSFVENSECIFYEIGYRLTGSLEYKIISHASGYDPMDLMINYAVTGKPGKSNLKLLANPDFQKYYCNITFLVKPGRIGKITGIEEILLINNVLDIFLSYNENDVIPEQSLGTLSQVIARVFAFAETKVELAKLMEAIQDTFKVYSPSGENMLLPPFNTEELFLDDYVKR